MSVPVTGLLVPYSGGTYAITDPLTGIDSWRSVADHAARNAIFSAYYRQGMVIVTQNDMQAWQATAATFTGTDADWTVFTGGISVFSGRASCQAATTANLTATYANGSSGVGATLTITGSLTVIDGYTLATSDRVLVKNQTTTLQNGIYTVTSTGASAVLTRATDFDAASSTEVVAGAYAIIINGTANGQTLWVETGVGPFTIGSTAIVFSALQTISGPGGTVTSVATGTGLTGGPITTTGTVSFAAISSHQVLANTTGGSAAPAGVTLTSLIDAAIGSAEGALLYRGASAWSGLAPGPDGDVLTTHGAGADPTWGAAGGAGTVTSITFGNGLTSTPDPITDTGTAGLAAIASHAVLANVSGVSAVPSATTVSALLDAGVGSSAGFLARLAGGWADFAPGAAGLFLKSTGTSAVFAWDTPGGGGGATGAVATMRFGLWSSLVVAAQVTQITPMVASGSFHGWQIGGLTGPVGADAIFDVLLSSNQGATWTSLWSSTPSNRPTIADGAANGSGTAFDTTSYAAGDWLIGSIIQIGSTTPGKNVAMEIY